MSYENSILLQLCIILVANFHGFHAYDAGWSPFILSSIAAAFFAAFIKFGSDLPDPDDLDIEISETKMQHRPYNQLSGRGNIEVKIEVLEGDCEIKVRYLEGRVQIQVRLGNLE